MHAEGGYHLPGCDCDTDENWSDFLHPDLLEEGEMLSQAAIRTFMREGRDPFRPGARPTRSEPEPPIPAPPAVSDLAQALRCRAPTVQAIVLSAGAPAGVAHGFLFSSWRS